MSILNRLSLNDLDPQHLWAELDAETREQAVRSLYRGEWEDPAGRREADNAIASAVRFRPAAVRKLPLDKRVGYMMRAVRPDDSLVRSLLLALHLDTRRSLLESFLDRLEIPQEGGMIDSDHDLEPPSPERLADAVKHLRSEYPQEQVDVYLASLLAMEPEIWEGLAEVIGETREG
jgi:hypothetical protein